MSFKLCGYSFEGPYSTTSSLENRSGVYLILKDNKNIIKSDVVDVGESAEVRNRVENHDRESCWKRNASTIYYAVHYTPHAQQSGRMEIEQALRKEIDPPCGKK